MKRIKQMKQKKQIKETSRVWAALMLCMAALTLEACGKDEPKDMGNAQGTQGTRTEQNSGSQQNPDSQQSSVSQTEGEKQPQAAPLAEAPASDFQYEEADGKIIIKHYTGESMEIAIPAQIDGKDVVAIGDYCFANGKITRVACPDTLETIEEFAFANCYDLAEISLNEGLQNIEKDAFLYCESLEYVNIPSTVEFVDELAFSAAGIKEINFLCGSVEWVNGAFNSIKITELRIPSNLETIGYAMFVNCKSLETVVIEDGVKTIEKRAFSSCKELKKASIPASVTEIGEDAFKNTSAELVLTVQPGSYAESYAKDNNIAYVNP